MEPIRTSCCIVGCGPAGAMLGLLLARQGLDVTVLEKHGDFLRDFRGDTIHPSTMEVLDEVDLAEPFLRLGPNRLRTLTVRGPDGVVPAADFGRLRTRFPFIAFIPQWDFLDFLTAQAAHYAGFRLLMRTEATGLVVEDGVVTGVTCSSPAGEVRVLAQLTVAADGRHSRLRAVSGLPLVNTSPPVDVLWFRLSRSPEDGEEGAGYASSDHIIVPVNRGDYWQVGYTIQKGSYDAVRAAGLEAFRRSLAAVPEIAGHADEIQSWEQISLLSVQGDRLRRWHRPGLLLIGDAAHAMTPTLGIGINVAIHDAVEAANVLAGPLARDAVTARHLAAVQRRRAWQVRALQALQAAVIRVALPSSARPSRFVETTRWLSARLSGHPLATSLPTRLIGLGIRRVHVRLTPPPAVRTSAQEPTPARPGRTGP